MSGSAGSSGGSSGSAISDVDCPSAFNLDECSHRTLDHAIAGNAFCGVMSVPRGFIYVAPLVPREGDTAFPAKASVAGIPIQPLQHGGSANPSHEQLALFLKTKAMVTSPQGFVGFSILYSPTKGGFGDTSRSQNNQHFRTWMFDNQDTAFTKYWNDKHTTATAANPVQMGAPAFHDVTKVGVSDGTLPSFWTEQIRAFLRQELGGKWTATITPPTVVMVTDPLAPNAPPLTVSFTPTPTANLGSKTH